jgi:hypothetical protein
MNDASRRKVSISNVTCNHAACHCDQTLYAPLPAASLPSAMPHKLCAALVHTAFEGAGDHPVRCDQMHNGSPPSQSITVNS